MLVRIHAKNGLPGMKKPFQTWISREAMFLHRAAEESTLKITPRLGPTGGQA